MTGPSRDPRAAFLRGKSTREILRRIWDGDPLELGPRCVGRIRERAILMDATRTLTYVMARVARHAQSYRATESLDAWLAARIDGAIDELLLEDRALDAQGAPVPGDALDHYAFMQQALDLPPRLGRKACVVFNSMPDAQRRALWAVLVDGRTIAEHAAASGASEARVRRYFEDAVALLSALGLGRRGRGGE